MRCFIFRLGKCFLFIFDRFCSFSRKYEYGRVGVGDRVLEIGYVVSVGGFGFRCF